MSDRVERVEYDDEPLIWDGGVGILGPRCVIEFASGSSITHTSGEGHPTTGGPFIGGENAWNPPAPATMFDNLGVAPNDDCPPTTVCDLCRAIVLCAEVWIQDGQLVCDTCHG